MIVIGHNRIRRVDSFEGYEVLAHPLANREDRVFRRGEAGASQVGVTYGSHDIQIARPIGPGSKGLLAILMHHGGGRYILEFYEGALPVTVTLLGLPERAQYALAYALFKQADECAVAARVDEASRWAQAFVDGRIRQRRRGGKRYVHIETLAEKERRCA